METQKELLTAIEAYIREAEMAESTFGKKAVNDGKFVSRLRDGANMTLATLEKAWTYLRENPVEGRAA